MIVGVAGAVALAEVIADNIRLVRLDLQENDIKTAGLMALSLALRVNESITRLDIDRETKRESVCMHNQSFCTLQCEP